MDLKLNSPGDKVPDVITALGGTVTNYVTLMELPANFAATKQYVDTVFSGLDITGQTFTITAASVVGAFSGDVVGSGSTVSLTPRLTAGAYPAVTVNTKGLVTAGGAITSTDLPFMSWTKLTTDLPTTAEGYGITDAMLTTGGSLTGNLTLSAVPSVAAHAASKGYVDGLSGASSSGVAVGDIIYKLTGSSYSGYLICNGSDVNKTTYSALFAILGTTFNFVVGDGNFAGAGKPWVRQYEYNFTQTAVLGAWTTYTALPATIYFSSVIVTNSRVFILGGLISGGWSGVVYTAPINTDGTLGTWATTTSLPATVGYSEAVVVSGGVVETSRVYVLASQVASAESPNVYSAPVNANGTLGAWVTLAPLPINLRYTQAVQTRTRLYLLGGLSNGVAMASVYSAPINPDGSLGLWVAGANLPATVVYSQAVVIKDKVFLLGGQIAGSFSAVVYQATVDAAGFIGTWSSATPLPVSYCYGQAVVTNTRVYLIGGQINGSASSAVYSAPIDAAGVIGAWALGTVLPGTVMQSACIVTSSRVYTLGGLVNGSASSTVYSASFAGGRSNYSQFYGGGYLGTSTTNFKLPDLSSRSQSGMSHYIKF